MDDELNETALSIWRDYSRHKGMLVMPSSFCECRLPIVTLMTPQIVHSIILQHRFDW
jgi:hypothetical protein